MWSGDARVPVRVVLQGDDEGWRCVVVSGDGVEERIPLGGGGVHWQSGGRRDGEPAWWRRRLGEIAESLRERVGMLLTDRCFETFGGEADIVWLEVDGPTCWEGLVTLREPDPARFPGRVAPFVVTLVPGRGALLPRASLLFDTVAADAWSTLEAVARSCGTPTPQDRFLCGWTGHRSVRVGRGRLAVSTERHPDGSERIGEVFAERPPGWGGNPPLRLRLDGIDLLDEPAGDVVELLRGLGHEVVALPGRRRVPGLGLVLHERRPRDAADGRFAGASLTPPAG